MTHRARGRALIRVLGLRDCLEQKRAPPRAGPISFRARNLTNAVYAAFSDPGYPDQVYLGDPRTYELAVSAKW